MSPKIKIAAAFFTAFLMAGSSLAQHTGPEDEPEGVPEAGPIKPADWQHYNASKDFQPTELPNGSVINTTSIARFAPIARMDGDIRAIPVTDNTWILGGNVYGSAVIETDEGLIIVSTGDSAETGRLLRKAIREQISEKPVITVIYDHIHGARGTQALLDGDDAPVIAHPDHNRIAEASGGLANPSIAELGPHLDVRGEMQFAAHLPANGPDAPPFPLIDAHKQSAWIPATQTVDDGETLTIAGIQMQFFHAITDTEDSLTIWIPEQKMVIDNVVWPVTNTYTLRGDRYRDPMNWIAALRQIRDLQPEIILSVGSGAMPLIGKQAGLDAVSALMDQMTFIYDQSLRLTSQGVNIADIRHHIKMPASILESQYSNEFYGQFDTFPQANPIYNHGWFSGYAEDIHSLPRAVQAGYMVKLAGGADKILVAYEEAMENGEYLWAKELATQLYYVEPGNDAYRQTLANVFRRLGQMSPGIIARNFYLNAANSLEGNENISLAGVQSEEWVISNPSRAVDFLRIRINPERADGVEGVLVFDLDGEQSALHVRNSIAEFVTDPGDHYRKPDARLNVSVKQFAAYYRGEIDAGNLISKGTADGRARELLELFDKYERVPMYPYSHRFLAPTSASAAVTVTDENFARAETDLYFSQQVERAAVNHFDHNRDSVDTSKTR